MAENSQKPNPYNNEVALKDLLKMMKRKERVTVSFVIDRYGYESIEVESKRMDKFILQLSNDLLELILKYLLTGDIIDPIPSAIESLIIRPCNNSDGFTSDILRSFIKNPTDRPHMHIVPEIVDKPDKLTVTFAYQFGIIVFKVKRTKETMEFLEKQGF